MSHEEITPAKFLTKQIESYWLFCNTQDVEQKLSILPDCCMDVIFDLSEKKVLVYGVTTTAQTVVIQQNQKLFGVRFQPGVLPLWLGISADSLKNRSIELKDINYRLYKKVQPILKLRSAGEIFETCNLIFSEELRNSINSALSEHLNKKELADFSVKKFANDIGIGVRHLERLFMKHVGITPKRFLKIRRLQSLKKTLERDKKTPVSLSLQYGYADQSHMSKEYKQLTGKSMAR